MSTAPEICISAISITFVGSNVVRPLYFCVVIFSLGFLTAVSSLYDLTKPCTVVRGIPNFLAADLLPAPQTSRNNAHSTLISLGIIVGQFLMFFFSLKAIISTSNYGNDLKISANKDDIIRINLRC